MTSDTGLKDMLATWYDDDGYNNADEDGIANEGRNPFAYENLEEDFERTPWVPPTMAIAEASMRRGMFRGGKAPLWSTTSRDMGDMGVGVALYFRFLYYLAVVFVGMSVLAVPALIMNSSGSRIPGPECDALGICHSTLGNVGDPSFASLSERCKRMTQIQFQNSSECNNEEFKLNVVAMAGMSMDQFQAAYMQTGMDFVYSLWFLLFTLFARWRLALLARSIEKGRVVTSDYSILVHIVVK